MFRIALVELGRAYVVRDEVGAVVSSGSLLQRLDELVVPGRRAAGGEDSLRHRQVVGSPAPWAAGPAELVAAIEHEAVRWARQVRDEIGYGPLLVRWTRSVPPAVGIGPELLVRERIPASHVASRPAALAALVDLPDRLDVLAQDDPERVAQIEERFVRFRRDALRLLGEVSVAWAHLHRMENLYEVSDPAYRLAGPVCQLMCRHASCASRRLERRPSMPVRCPSCGCRSLLLNAERGLVRCGNPGCGSAGGSWTLEEIERELVVRVPAAWSAESSMMQLPRWAR